VKKAKLTLTERKSAKSSCYEIPNSASSMHGRTLFPHRKSRGYHEGLFIYFRLKIIFKKPPEIVSFSLTSVKLLIRNVQKPRNPSMTNPKMMHLISEIPEPAAYLAKDWTRRAATKANAAFCGRFRQPVFTQQNEREGVVCGMVGVGREEEGREIVARTANSTYINQRATVTVLHRCQESHPLSSSPSNSQQQNC
jgi:hypothetical protein